MEDKTTQDSKMSEQLTLLSKEMRLYQSETNAKIAESEAKTNIRISDLESKMEDKMDALESKMEDKMDQILKAIQDMNTNTNKRIDMLETDVRYMKTTLVQGGYMKPSFFSTGWTLSGIVNTAIAAVASGAAVYTLAAHDKTE